MSFGSDFGWGGQPGYGLRRRVVTENGVVRGVLAPGEWKMIGRDRVVLIHGPQEEVEYGALDLRCLCTQGQTPSFKLPKSQ